MNPEDIAGHEPTAVKRERVQTSPKRAKREQTAVKHKKNIRKKE
jgi:hypothetical protein